MIKTNIEYEFTPATTMYIDIKVLVYTYALYYLLIGHRIWIAKLNAMKEK